MSYSATMPAQMKPTPAQRALSVDSGRNYRKPAALRTRADVTRDRDVRKTVWPRGESDGDDFAIGLEDTTVGSVVQWTEGGADFAAAAKRAIELAVGSAAREQEVGIGRFGVRVTYRDDFAVALHEHLVGDLQVDAEINHRQSRAVKGRVECAV